MSADNGIIIKETTNGSWEVYEYNASVGDASSAFLSAHADLRSAVQAANEVDTEYGIMFAFTDPWKKNLAGVNLMMDWIQDILKKNFPGDMADGLLRLSDDTLRIKSVSTSAEFKLSMERIK